MTKKLTKTLIGLFLAVILVCSVSAFISSSAFASTSSGYTVTFVTDGGTTYFPATTESEDQAVLLPVPEKFGYIFTGWYDNSDFEGESLSGEYVPTGNVTLYAKWEDIKYFVTLNSNGGTKYRLVTSNGLGIQLPVPVRAEYVFDGWYENMDFSGEKLGEVYVPYQSITLYAKWNPVEYVEISFDSQGGSKLDSVKMNLGENVALPEPDLYEYGFKGWYKNSACLGDAVEDTSAFTEDITLYAKWERVSYLYLYHGQLSEHKRLAYTPGTTIKVSEIERPDALVVDGTSCPFVKWVYDGTEADLPAEIKLDTHVYLLAVYDYSNLPAKEHIKQNDDGSYTATGKVIKVLVDENKQQGSFSMDITIRKGKSGGANVAFRMITTGVDYEYENAGTSYICIGLLPTDGGIQIGRILNGGWAKLCNNLTLASLPASWQTKYNSARESDKIVANVQIDDFGDSFKVYIDGELVYTYSDATTLSSFTGTGFGLRSSMNNSTYANWKYSEFKTVKFDTNGGSALSSMKYGSGTLNTETPTRSSYVFNGWYYDKDCTSKVDVNAPVINGEVTLYAGWRYPAGYVTDNKNGTYTVNKTTAWIMGECNYDYAVYEMNMKYTQGVSGGGGMAIRMKLEGDYSYEATAQYISIGLLPDSGKLQIGRINGLNGSNFTQMTGSQVALSNLPSAWQTKHNNTASGSVMEVKLTVRDYGTYFEVYIDDNLAYTSTDDLSAFTSNLYGVRSSVTNLTFSMSVSSAITNGVKVTFTSEGNTVATKIVEAGSGVRFPDAPTMNGYTKDNGNIVTYTFSNWKLPNGNYVTSSTVFNEDTVLTAEFSVNETRRGASVTYDASGKEVYTLPAGSSAVVYSTSFPGLEAESGELKATVKMAVKQVNAEVRINFFALCTDKVIMQEGTSYSNCFINFYPQSGQISLGGKMYNDSKQPFRATIDGLKDCSYKTYWNSLSSGSVGTFRFKIQYGVFSSGNAWIKVYANDSLLLIYGLTEADIGSETLYGTVCTANDTSKTHMDKYLLAGDKSLIPGYKTGYTVWQTVTSPIVISDISLTPLNGVSATALNSESSVESDCVNIGVYNTNEYVFVNTLVYAKDEWVTEE